jgi:AraC-like DNA-binding protein
VKNVQPGTSPSVLRLITANPQHRTREYHRHEHPFYELGLVLAGECGWRVGKRQRLTLRAGEAVLLRPGTVHWEEVPAGREASLAWVGFDFAGPAPDWSHRVIVLEDDFAEVGSHFRAVLREHHLDDERTRLRVSLALQSLLLLVGRRAEAGREKSLLATSESGLNPRQKQMVESAAHYFRNNLQQPLSIAQVAAYHSLCPAHFSWLFRRRHGLNPRSFLREARLERSVELLTLSEMALKEIAQRCGFVDAAHLCKAFRSRHGTTPMVYRKKKRPVAPLEPALVK